jgi:hypothetical protein
MPTPSTIYLRKHFHFPPHCDFALPLTCSALCEPHSRSCGMFLDRSVGPNDTRCPCRNVVSGNKPSSLHSLIHSSPPLSRKTATHSLSLSQSAQTFYSAQVASSRHFHYRIAAQLQTLVAFNSSNCTRLPNAASIFAHPTTSMSCCLSHLHEAVTHAITHQRIALDSESIVSATCLLLPLPTQESSHGQA